MLNQENNQNKKQEEHFNVPDGYFQKSVANILNKIEWEEEIKNYPLLGKLKGNINFIIPENYFEKSEIKIEILAYEKLATIKRVNSFDTPENYFEEKESIIKSELIIEEDELAEMPILKSNQKRNNFDLPESYFEENKIELKNLLQKNKTAKIIPISFSRMAIAAAAMLVISLGLWVYKTYYQTLTIEDCGTLACIEKRELLKSQQLENLDNDELYELVNPNNLEKDLQKNTINVLDKKDTGNKNSVSDELLDEI